MDALNSTYKGHVVLFVSQNSTSVYTKEATTDGSGQKAKDYARTWTQLDRDQYKPIRYNRIVDDHLPLPIINKNL